MKRKKPLAEVPPKPTDYVRLETSIGASIRQKDGSLRYRWKDRKRQLARILEARAQKPDASYRELARMTFMSRTTVQRVLDKHWESLGVTRVRVPRKRPESGEMGRPERDGE